MTDLAYKQINRDSIAVIVERGTEICRKLKEAYYPAISEKEAYRSVSEIFTAIKAKMRELMPYTTDDALLKHLITYSVQDLQEVYQLTGERTDAKTNLEATP